MSDQQWPQLGFGVGLRTQHYPVVLSERPAVDWFEAITENYMDTGGRPLQILEHVREHYPVGLHGVALSIGSTDELSSLYLERLRKLVDRIQPEIVSDHLCWSGVKGDSLHDLLPLPFTEEAVRHVVSRVQHVQEILRRPILLENVSTYVTYKHSAMSEWEFLREIAKRSGCGILLDLNNIYVNSVNHKFDPYEYLKGIPREKVAQFHLAGHTDMGTFLFDTHSGEVIESVWNLYRAATRLYGPVSALIEWDEAIPEFPRLLEEANRAKAIYHEIASFPIEKVSETRPPQRRTDPSSVLADNDVIVSEAKQSLSAKGPSLAQTESWMKSLILNESTEAPNEFLNPQGGVSGVERLSVYASGYEARFLESLKDIYEATAHFLGEESFQALNHAYLHEYPSHEYNLNLVGRHLPAFLKSWKPATHMPYLSDLAQLEWLIACSFHAFGEPAMKASELSGIALEDWEKTRINFQPFVFLFASDWPVVDLWIARKRSLEKSDLNVARNAQKILIGRRGVQVLCELLTESQYVLLSALLSGRTLGDALEVLPDGEDGNLPPLAEWFSAWSGSGFIAGFEIAAKHRSVAVPR